MKATFENTVDILVKAYLNDKLRHGDCYACAVTNIIESEAASLGIPKQRWNSLFCTIKGKQYLANQGEILATDMFSITEPKSYKLQDIPNPEVYSVYEDAVRLVNSVSYTKEQLMKIEFVFETAPRGNSTDEYMFNGLMAVVEVLADIHGISLEAKEKSKLLFVKL